MFRNSMENFPKDNQQRDTTSNNVHLVPLMILLLNFLLNFEVHFRFHRIDDLLHIRSNQFFHKYRQTMSLLVHHL